ncbi:MAG: hypothetical protein WDA09_09490 [Bacteriovoracaceae bacterium]
MDNKQIIELQKQKIASHFSDSQALLDYMIETLSNFYYRYLETTKDQDLQTIELGPKRWGAQSNESNNMEILKIKNPNVRPHLIEAAKSLGAQGGLSVQYTLGIEPLELNSENGEIIIFSKIDWSSTPIEMSKTAEEKTLRFKYQSLGEFRKGFALKLEEACEIFL